MTVSWGIVGAGNIAHRFARSLSHESHSRLLGLSCRSAAKAAAFSEEFGVDEAHVYAGTDAHERLLADPAIDAVYLALPHALHLEWATAALEGGKAVLSEKPAALNAEEMQQIANTSRRCGVLYMEGMKTRFTPCYQRIRKLVAEGAIGEVTSLDTTLCNDMAAQIEANQSYHVRRPGGGVLLDCGCYCATWLEDYLPGEVTVTEAEGTFKNGVDYYVDARLSIGEVPASLECAFDRKRPRRATIRGSRGMIVVDELHRPQEALVTIEGEEPWRISEPYLVDDFYGQIEHFSQLLRNGQTESPIVSLDASVRSAQILDAIRAAL